MGCSLNARRDFIVDKSEGRLLRGTDAYCPSCGHNRDTSCVSSVRADDGVETCQMCRACWRESVWINIEYAKPDVGCIDVIAFGRRYTNCYYDRVCDEWRCLGNNNFLIRLSGVTHWMYEPEFPEELSE